MRTPVRFGLYGLALCPGSSAPSVGARGRSKLVPTPNVTSPRSTCSKDSTDQGCAQGKERGSGFWRRYP